MPRIFKRPVLHFFVLGSLLYLVVNATEPPTPPPSVDYPSDDRIAQLQSEWLASTGRPPDAATLEQLIQLELDQDMLFSEALRLNLHLHDGVVQQRLLRDMRFLGENNEMSDADLLAQAYELNMHANDLVVRRRLMQAMESIYRAPGEAQQPTGQDLEKIYREQAAEFTLPATAKMSHVFVSGDKYGAEAKARAQRFYKSFAAANVTPEKAQESSDPFLSGMNFAYLSVRQLQKHFGESFARQVFECPLQQWCKPLTSPYGEHLVWVHGTEEAKLQPLEGVRDKLLYHFKRQQGDAALTQRMQALRQRYALVKP